MRHLKSPDELEKMRRSNGLVARVHEALREKIVPGATTLELDQLAESIIREAGGTPAFKGYQGYPATVCASVNEQVVHGIPNDRPLEEGDVLSLDIGVRLEGYFGDMARTLPVGEIDEEAGRLLEDTAAALRAGVAMMREGNRVGDISSAIQTFAEERGYGVVTKFVGHGIGQTLHELPQVPNVGKPGSLERLYQGMVLAIEPMLNCGSGDVKVLSDNWTVVTIDGKLSAHFEDTVAVTTDGPEVLTTSSNFSPTQVGDTQQ